MIKLICERYLCKYYLYGQCRNENVVEEFKEIKTVTEVILSVSQSSCNEYDEAKEEQMQADRNNAEQQAGERTRSLLAVREKYLRELQGRPHLPFDPKNCKPVRSDIEQMYFFGRKCSKEDIHRVKWK